MSWEGYRPVPIDRLCSLVTSHASEKLPNGVSPDTRNVRFTMNSVATRWGTTAAIITGQASKVTGLGVLVQSGAAAPYIPLIFHYNGKLFKEYPVGSGQVVEITPSFGSLTTSAYMEMASSFQRAHLTFGDQKVGTGAPLAFNGTNLDPWSMRPVGEAWTASTRYEVGEVVAPTPPNGHIYRCSTAGTSASSQPSFTTTAGGTTADGTATWTENSFQAGNQVPTPPAPTLTRIAAGGAWAAGLDVWVRITIVNGVGETIYSASTKIGPTVLNDQTKVTSPTVPAWLSTLGAPYAITNYKVYAGTVATGGVEPAYQLQGTSAIGTDFTFSAIAAGAAPPSTNTANITAAGNVATGTRYLTVLFVNRNGYISGATTAATLGIALTAASLRVFIGTIPLGPANTTQRIVAMGTTSGTVGGPFLYIPAADLSASISQSAFVINDNTTTSATLNFSDDYLANATDVTDNLRKVKLPPQASTVYIPAVRRMMCFGESGRPSLVRVSETDDPETFYGDTGYFYVSRDDGQRVVTARDFRGEVYVFKERSVFTMQYGDSDPATWPVIPRWQKHGAPGPRAVDVGSEFMAFANRSGAFIYQGDGPTWVSAEIQDQWDKINWTYEHLIACHIDEEQKEVRFSVPFGSSQIPNKTFTMNYLRGLDPPIHFSTYIGKEIANPQGRKWSIDDIAATQIIRAERPITFGATSDQADNILANTQMLIASPFDEGIVNMVVPDSYNDNGAGINSYYELASVGIGDPVARFGGYALSADGAGVMQVDLVAYNRERTAMRDITLGNPKGFYKSNGRGIGRQFGLRFSNDNVPDAWFELFSLTLYMQGAWPSER